MGCSQSLGAVPILDLRLSVGWPSVLPTVVFQTRLSGRRGVT